MPMQETDQAPTDRPTINDEGWRFNQLGAPADVTEDEALRVIRDRIGTTLRKQPLPAFEREAA